ncbi:UNVERIFIED_CONTAM: tricorn protease [Streptomyces canus]
MSYLRLPHLSGDLLCFVAEDDLWLAPLDGPGRAWRLTVDRTKVGHPRFSPDGRHIAYTSWRSLVPEIHLADVDGGPGRRLTYWGSADTQVCGWTPCEGDKGATILAVASHGEPFSYFTWAYKVPTDGSPGRKLPWGPVSDIQVADRRTLLLTGTPPHEPAAWKRYRGGATGRLWLHGERLLPDLGGHLHSPMFVGDRIAFLSDHEGVGNLYSCAHDGSDLRRHTDHDAFYARHASSDGTRVVYQCGGDLWMVDDLSSEARRLDVRLSGPRAGRRTYQVPASQHVDGISVDETGRASAVVVRGSLYWLTHRDGPARTITDTPGVRVRLPEMLGSVGQVAYVTDAEGEDAIEIAYLPRATGDREPRRLASGELGRVLELVSDPQGERLALASHDGRLLLLDATEDSDGEVTELIQSVNGPVRDLAFSPDGSWLTWSHPGIGRTLRQIKMARMKDRLIVDVTNGRFEDENPVFTRDGRYLAFLSWRGFDPVYDVHTGDLSFPLGCRPYLVPLSSATPSPFALNPEGRPAAGGLDPVEDESGEGGAVTVELEGLESRVTPFPVTASKYSALHPVAGGGLVWLRWPISGALGETFVNPDDTSERPTLEHFSIGKAKKTELVEHLDWFAVSGDGSRLVLVDEGDLRATPATESGDSDTIVWIDLRRILHEVDPAAEWRQSYEEAGRLIRSYFWEPGMCGIDWDAVLDQYRPLVERVASPDEFADLLREVLGELGTSHAYVTAARRNEGPPHYQRRQGLLGANLVLREGGWAVKRILPGDSSDSKARSPLAGTGIREGAVLTHVDGRAVDAVAGPYPLLAAAGGTTVELTFAPAGGGARPGGGGPARGRAPPALPGLGGQTPCRGTGVERRPVRLSAHPRHGRLGLGPVQQGSADGGLPPRPHRRRTRQRGRPHQRAGRGETDPHDPRLGPDEKRPAGVVRLERPARPGGRPGRRGDLLRRRHDHGGIQTAEARSRGGPAHLGRRGRHDRPPPARRRNGDHRTDERGVVRRVRLVHREPGRAPGPGDPPHPTGLGGGPPRPTGRRGDAGAEPAGDEPPGDAAQLPGRTGQIEAEASAEVLKGIQQRRVPSHE